MKSIVKNIAVGLGAIALFLALSYGFVPQVLDGKIVNQSDISGYVGMSHEMTEWNKAHPDNPTYWTDSRFTTGSSPESGRPPTCSLRCWGPSCCSWHWG